MNCPNCGHINPEGSAVCGNCGQSLAAAPPAPPAPPIAPAPPTPPAGYAAPQAPAGYAAPQAPAGYAAPQQAAQPGVTYASPVSNNLVFAILATIFCNLLFGIIGIIYATQVNTKLFAGDYAGAQRASKSAAVWSWVAVASPFVAGILFFILTVILGTTGAMMDSF